jgi:toxin ParE1/3/4
MPAIKSLRESRRVRRCLRSTADFPASGSPRPALGRNARIALVHPFVLIYDYVDDTVTVLRVLHGRRNIAPEILKR